MHLRLLIAIVLLPTLAGWPALAGWSDRDPSWPHSGPMPDEVVHVPSTRYVPIGAGTNSYRPVEPTPWGDVNQRVAPQGAIPAPNSAPAANDSGATKSDAMPAPPHDMKDMKDMKGMTH